VDHIDAAAAPEQAEAPRPDTLSLDDLVRHMTRGAATILGDVDPARPLTLSGMDSLLAAKFRTWLRHELDVHLPLRELLRAGSLIELAKSVRVGEDLADNLAR
jgi:Phosphopantetheine attachment site